MSGLTALFSIRAIAGRRLSRRRSHRGVVAGERLEPRALLAVSVPPSITSDTVEIDDNVVVASPGGSITATGGPGTSGYVQIFGNSKGRIDGTPGQSDEDLALVADSFITVTGGIGGVQRLDDLTLTSATAQPINLQQVVSLTGDLRVTKAGTFTVGSTVTIDGDLVIDEATMVSFAGDVTVGGDLTITNATGVTFAGTLTVGGALTIANATGTTRFGGNVLVGSAAITSSTLVQVQADFTTTGADGDGDVTFTTDQINFTTASLGVDLAVADATLVIRPRTASLPLTVASPPGIPAGLNITDADILAIQAGWKRVVFGDEAAGTGAVRIGSIGSQYGGFSQILNTTTIVGGTIDVVQPVDVTTLADYLDLVARGTGSGDGRITISAPINQTEGERNDWVRLTSAGTIQIDAPIWAGQTVSLTTTAGGTITQGGTAAAITAPGLAVLADGSVTLADPGNVVTQVAVETTNDDVVLREDSGYAIAKITTTDGARDVPQTVSVTGIDVGTGTVRLVTVSAGNASQVTQSQAILAGGLGLQGPGTDWLLENASNDVATLAGSTGSITFRDADDLEIGTVAAVSPQAAVAGITVAGKATVTAGTTLSLTADGDIVSDLASGTAVTLSAPSGILTAGDVETAGADVDFNHAVTLTGDVVLDLEDGSARGVVTFADAVDGTTAGQDALEIAGDLDASASIGSAVALEAFSVSGDSTLAGGVTLRTTGNQTYSGDVLSTGTITIQAGKGSMVGFLGDVSLGGLVTATADTAAYDVALTGAIVSITNAVTFANTGTTRLGDADTDSLSFGGGLTSTAPALTELAGTIATANANASFGTTELIADTTVSTGSGAASFTGTVDGGFSLTVNAAGDTTFDSMVGYFSPLESLATDAAGLTRLNGGTFVTSGPAGILFNDPIVLGHVADLTAQNQGPVTFASTVDGSFPLTSRTGGMTTFGGAVGSITPLTLVTTDTGGETRIDGGSVTTSGANGQIYGDAVLLGAATALTATNSGLVIFASTLDGGHSLAVNTAGLTSFGDAVGGTTPLESLVTDAAGTTKIAGGSVATSGAAGQVYGDAVELQADTTLTAQASGPITLASTLDGTVTLNVDTEGTTTFGGAVGGTIPLGGIVTDAGGTTRIDGGSVRTVFAAGQVYGDAVLLGADTTLTADSAGVIRFANTLDGAFTLAANTQGTTTFAGAVGGTTPLASLATDAGGTTFVTGLLVKTSGNQTYADPVGFDPLAAVTPPASIGPDLFTGDAFDLEVLLPEQDPEEADVDSSIVLPPETLLEGATVSLLQGLDGGGHELVIAANAVFGDQPGSTLDSEPPVDPVTNLESLTVSGTTTVNSTSVTTAALQTYQGGVTLGSDAVFQGSGLRFDSTIAGPGRSLALVASNQGITLGGDVGTANAPLGPIQAMTFVGTILIEAGVYSTGPVTFVSVFGSVDGGPANAIYVPAGDISLAGMAGIGATNPIAVEAASVAAISSLGDVRLRGIGDLVVGNPGITAGGTLDLDASGEIRVPGGRMLRGEEGVTATKPIRWGLLGTADSGAGSLRDVIAQANATRVAGIVEFGSARATFKLQSQLPDIATSLLLDGGGQVTIDGGRRAAHGLTFVAGSAGSDLRGVRLRNFTNFGIRLLDAPGVSVSEVRVTSLNTATSMGLYATGDLAGTTIVSSRFTGGLRGALLVNARNLTFGALGQGNTFTGNRAVPGSRFAGTGIRAQGNSAGTVVEGNTFTRNNYGFAFINARNLRLSRNVFTRNTSAGVLIEGNNLGSVSAGNKFGTGAEKNGRNIQRVRGARGL